MPLTYRLQELRADAAAERFDPVFFSRTDRFAFSSDAGAMRSDVFTLAGASIRFGRVTSTGHEIELMEERHATLLMPTRGRLEARVVGRQYRSEAGGMLALRPNRRRTLVIPAADGPYRAVVMLLPFAKTAQASRAEGVPRFLHGRDGGTLHGPEARRLRDYLDFLIDDLLRDAASAPQEGTSRGIRSLLDDLIEDLFSGGSDGDASPPVRAISTRRVRRAEDVLRARADEPLSIAALAQEIGVGLRSLQLSFREVHGMAPREILNRLRLERARERLLDADPSEQVTTIALDCGFTHLGRFAETYRKAFGERPSETLRSGRA